MFKVLKLSLLDSGMVKTSPRGHFLPTKNKMYNANNVCPIFKWSQWQVRETKL